MSGLPKQPLLTVAPGCYRLGLTHAQRAVLAQRHPLFGAEWYWGTQDRIVESPGFCLAKTPVTNAQYCAFLNTVAPKQQQAYLRVGTPYLQVERQDGIWQCKPGFDRHPISGITHTGAAEMAAWCGGRLPTEDEWEIAARAGETTLWPWGDADPSDQCNHYDLPGEFPESIRPRLNDARGPLPINYFPANAWGFQDMLGNLWEWCAAAPGVKDYVPLKGGSWNDIATIAFLPSLRHRVPRSYPQTYCFGMRLAGDLP